MESLERLRDLADEGARRLRVATALNEAGDDTDDTEVAGRPGELS